MSISENFSVPCPKCGKPLSASKETTFPDNAPISVKKICPQCDSIAPNDNQFCPECGTKISASLSKPTQSESLERQRIAEMEKEKEQAIQKRAAAAAAAHKRKCLIIFVIICSLVVLAMVGMVRSAKNNLNNRKLRNFATESMTADYTNVYADIVSMEPKYFIYTKSNYMYLGITEIVCKCKTVEGKTIWICVDLLEYPGGSAHDEDSFVAQYYSTTNPKRIVGSVISSGKVEESLENKIGDIFLLDVKGKIGE